MKTTEKVGRSGNVTYYKETDAGVLGLGPGADPNHEKFIAREETWDGIGPHATGDTIEEARENLDAIRVDRSQ